MTMRVAVIGGGLAGLTAAWQVRRLGLAALVLEAGDDPGGRTRSATVQGVTVDTGAWSFPTSSMLPALAHTVGVGAEVTPVSISIGRPAGGRLRAAPLRSPPALLRRRVLSPNEARHALRAWAMARRPRTRGPDEPAAIWAARHFPPSFQVDVLRPLAGLFFLQDPASLSRDALLGTLAYLGRARLHAFRAGMGTLATALAAQVPIRYSARVDALTPDDGGVRVAGEGWAATFDAAIVATPLPEAGDLLGPLLPLLARAAVAGLPYAPAIVVHLLLRARWPTTALVVLPPPGDGSSAMCGVVMQRAIHPARVPPGCEALALYAAAEHVAALTTLDDQHVAEALIEDVERWVPGTRRQVAGWRVQRWPTATARVDVGGRARIEQLKAGLAEVSRDYSIWVAGDYLGQSSVDGAARTGLEAGTACVAALRTARSGCRPEATEREEG